MKWIIHWALLSPEHPLKLRGQRFCRGNRLRRNIRDRRRPGTRLEVLDGGRIRRWRLLIFWSTTRLRLPSSRRLCATHWQRQSSKFPPACNSNPPCQRGLVSQAFNSIFQTLGAVRAAAVTRRATAGAGEAIVGRTTHNSSLPPFTGRRRWGRRFLYFGWGSLRHSLPLRSQV